MRETTVAPSGPSTIRSPTAQCRRLRTILGPAAEIAFAEDHATTRPMRRTARATRVRRVELSISRPLGTCVPRRLAGIVAASLAITTSYGLNRSISRDRGTCRIRARRVDGEKPGIARALDGRGRGDHRSAFCGAGSGQAGGCGRRSRSARSARGLTLPDLSVWSGPRRESPQRAAGCPCRPGRTRSAARRLDRARPARCASGAAALPCSRRKRPSPPYALTAASLEMLTTTAPRPSRADAASEPSSAFVSRKGPSRFVASACFEILAVRVCQRYQRHRPQAGGVVDQDVHARRGALAT